MNKNVKPRGSHSHSINVFFWNFWKVPRKTMVDLQFYQKWSLSLKKFLNTSSHLTPKPIKYHSFHIFSYLEQICWNTYLKRPKQWAGHCFDDSYERWISVCFLSCYMNFFFPQINIKKQTVLLFRDQQGET